MALTVTPKSDKPGRAAVRPMYSKAQRAATIYVFELALDAACPTTAGGYLFDSTVVGSAVDMLPKGIEQITFAPIVCPGGAGGLTAGHLLQAIWNPATNRIRMFDNNAEVADGTSLALFTAVKGRAYGYA